MKWQKKVFLALKKIADFFVALLLTIITAPLMIVIAICIKSTSKGPVFFRQERIGKNNKPFFIYKFRTMRTQTYDVQENALSDYERMTKVGLFLRKTSLDELPQIWNILRGEMSFIGPRPLLPQYLERYNAEQIRRHEVTPGISGYAQVNGRNAITWQQKFEYDVYYVANQSFRLDAQIFFLTIKRVIQRGDVDQREGQTMDFFQGNDANIDE